VRRAGAALYVAGDRPTALDGGAREVAHYAPGETRVFLEALHGGSGAGGGIAEGLRGAERVVIVWGERLAREPGAAAALLRAAGDLPDARLLGIPEVTNGRGLREVGCLPDAGPGYRETTAGLGADRIRAGLADGELTGLVLFGADPLRDAPDTGGWRKGLSGSDFTVAFSMFRDASTATADVVFPLESHAEKEGSVTHPDGRLQRVRPSARHPGDVRPAWLVLTELAAALGHETGFGAAKDVFAAIADEVPFYGGLTYEEIGGRGIRWQDRPSASRFSQAPAPLPSAGNGESGDGAPPDAEQELKLGTYRDIWAGPVTELNPALAFLKPRQQVEISLEDAERIGVSDGDLVEVSVGDESVRAPVAINERLRAGAIFLIEGTEEANANALLGRDAEPVAVRKLEAAELVEVAG
jgi:NADH-quinone oxidoreductase subunit G